MPEHILHLSAEAERLVDAIAAARARDDPDALGPLGHTPDVARDAFSLGLAQLARRHGLAGRNVSDEIWARLRAAVEARDLLEAAEQADRFLAELALAGPPASWAVDREGQLTVALVVHELAMRVSGREVEAERLAEAIASTFVETGRREQADVAGVLREAVDIGLDQLGHESGLFARDEDVAAVTHVTVRTEASVELRTDQGGRVAVGRDTLERALALLDAERERGRQ